MAIKKAIKTRKNFRLSSAAIKRIAELAAKTHNTQTMIVERAVELLHAQIVKGNKVGE